MVKQFPSFQEVQDVSAHLHDLALQYWLHHNLFSLSWWILLVIAIAPWTIWWQLVEKRKISEILIYGLMVASVATLFDCIGTSFVWWGYPTKLFPFPPMLPLNFALLPVIYMLLYQYFPNGKNFITASILVSAVFSFIAEPILQWMNIYKIYHWKYIYSFAIYPVMSCLLKVLMQVILRHEAKT